MRAVELRDSFGIDSLTLVERPIPTPGRYDVLVRVRATSLNYRDYLIAVGEHDPTMRLPITPLSDGAGEVVEIGPDVTRVGVGDRVAGIFMQGWIAGPLTAAYQPTALGADAGGMLAEYVVLNQQGVVKIPDALSFEEAATLPCAAVTAWNALVRHSDLKSGETILTQGTGGVSLFALQFAHASGARVILTSSSDEKLKRAMELGADTGINYRKDPDWATKAREATRGRGVDHVLDVGGPGTLGQSIEAVRESGTVCNIGVLTGFGGEVPTAKALFKEVKVQGVYVGSRALFEDMLRAIELHRIHPTIDRSFKMEEIRDAIRYLKKGQHFGKIVVIVGES
jgi:NADPH:quinone reductase-like Zn-dependent oxidoreductase